MRLESETYVLLSDASKALLLVNKGDVDMLDLRVVNVFQHDNPPSRELGSDRPGRFPTPDGGRTSTEEADWHDKAEARFLADVARETLKVLADATPASLVLAADPRSLGELRTLLADSGSIRLVAEIHRDLVHQPTPDIEAAILSA
jgi:protein required for attachment to host cells